MSRSLRPIRSTDARYQNCTEYTLDLINAAIYDTTDRRVLKANARAYFEPQPVEPGPVTLLLGQLFRSDLRLADQTESPLRIATFNTLANYLGEHGLLKRRYTVHAEP